jgi:hypothetical protein
MTEPYMMTGFSSYTFKANTNGMLLLIGELEYPCGYKSLLCFCHLYHEAHSIKYTPNSFSNLVSFVFKRFLPL